MASTYDQDFDLRRAHAEALWRSHGRIFGRTQIVKSGSIRGFRYEIYYPTKRVRHSSGRPFTYGAIVYVPDAEVAGYGLTLDEAVDRADRYIRAVEKESGGSNLAQENPLSTGAWLGIGAAVIGVGVIAYLALKSSTASAGTPALTTGGTVNQLHNYTFTATGAANTFQIASVNQYASTIQNVFNLKNPPTVNIASDGSALNTSFTAPPGLTGSSAGSIAQSFGVSNYSLLDNGVAVQ